MRHSIKQHSPNWVLMFLALVISLVMTTMPLSRIMTPAQASNNGRDAKQQSKGAAAGKATPASELMAVRAPGGADAAGSAQAINLDTSLTSYVDEKESNNTAATAQALTGRNVKVKGHIQFNRVPASPTPNDFDFYSFTATAGDRVYAATQTQFGSVSNTGGQSGDTVIEIFDTDGTTLLEADDDEGTFATTASTIAGLTLPTTGIYFIQVRPFDAIPVAQILPYDLYLRLQSGAPTPETEPNGTTGTANPLSLNGWASGAISAPGDIDIFSLNLNAGDTVYLSLDNNPERDGVNWNSRLGFGLFDGFFLQVNDTDTATPPNSEAMFFTVREAGTYFVQVDAPAGTPDPTFTYHLSVSVHPPSDRRCTTYTSTDVPKTIPAAASTVTSTLSVPDSKKIANLKVNLNITHSALAELDVSLIGPGGNEVLLFDDPNAAAVGATAPQINLTLDDEAAIPLTPTAGVYKSMIFQTEGLGRLDWFKNQFSNGTWTLTVRDDAATGSGTLNGWGITVCEDPDLSCPATLSNSIFSNDFEANDGAFTHTGSADEWEYGTPSFAPITTCNSGTKCWKTDLDGAYNQAPSGTANVDQELISPTIDLTSSAGRQITFQWAMKYQTEGAHWDHIFVEVRDVSAPTNVKRVFEHRGPAMSRSVGSPAVTIQESAGWATWQADISEFGGKTVQLVFHTDQDDSINFAGLAVDDVSVTACRLPSRADFDGNGPTNLSVVRPNADGLNHLRWYILNSNLTSTEELFGNDTDKPVPADYDGDGDIDIAVFRPIEGAWYVSLGGALFNRFEWGSNGDIPVPGDYDGDGKADLAVFRPADSTWYVQRSAGGITVQPWGISTDKPVQADYDGDGKTDVAVFRSGIWYVLTSFTGGVREVQWGLSTDIPVTGDYDGDRQFDVAVFRPADGTWYALLSSTKALRSIQWGTLGDVPVPGDYDGDRKYDPAVFRNGDWYILQSTNGASVGSHWGQAGDKPAPPAGNVPE